MIYTTIGVIVGLVMGLTGAGGALISIPLFLTLLNTSLKEATILSLIAVVFGTSINLYGNLSRVNSRLVIILSLAGSFTNYLSLPLKQLTPEYVIAILLAFIGIYSIWSVWQDDDNSHQSEKKENITLKPFLAGIFLGLITTLTGLGGGVILMPLLMRLFGESFKSALPTSLATILIISLTAFLLQAQKAMTIVTLPQLGFIGGGAVLSYFLLKIGLRKFKDSSVLKLRRVVFTSVTLYSIVNVMLKTI